MNLSKEFIEANKKVNLDKEKFKLVDQRSIEYVIFFKENFNVIKKSMKSTGIKINKENIIEYISSVYNLKYTNNKYINNAFRKKFLFDPDTRSIIKMLLIVAFIIGLGCIFYTIFGGFALIVYIFILLFLLSCSI